MFEDFLAQTSYLWIGFGYGFVGGLIYFVSLHAIKKFRNRQKKRLT